MRNKVQVLHYRVVIKQIYLCFYSFEKRDKSQIISSEKLKTEDCDAFQSQVCLANLCAKQFIAAQASKG